MNLETKHILIILDDYFHYLQICYENKIIWEDMEQQLWEKLLKINGISENLPNLSTTIKLYKRLKKNRNKNIKVYKPLPKNSPILTKLFRDTAWSRHQKFEQFATLFKRLKKKKIHRFYPSVSSRYKNLKDRRVA